MYVGSCHTRSFSILWSRGSHWPSQRYAIRHRRYVLWGTHRKLDYLIFVKKVWLLDMGNLYMNVLQELLALGERIGHVSTGLSEESITNCLKTRTYISSTCLNLEEAASMDLENDSCIICQVLSYYSSSWKLTLCNGWVLVEGQWVLVFLLFFLGDTLPIKKNYSSSWKACYNLTFSVFIPIFII